MGEFPIHMKYFYLYVCVPNSNVTGGDVYIFASTLRTRIFR